MDLTLLKSILLAAMLITTLVCGLIPIQILRIIKSPSGLGPRASLFISLLSCFAGGVFLGVCFLDMLIDSLEAMDNVKKDFNYNSDYPFVSLIFLIAFFSVWIMEELIHKYLVPNEEENTTVEVRNRAMSYLSTIYMEKGFNIEVTTEKKGRSEQESIIKSITLVVAFLFHVTLEGFAFGIQEDVVGITSLFFGIIVHKAIVCFSVGMRLAVAHPNKTWLVVLLISIVAIMAPLGGTVGILVESSHMNMKTKDIITTIFMSASLGTFLYISFFEILSPELANQHSNILQWFSAFAGMSLIAGIMVFGG